MSWQVGLYVAAVLVPLAAFAVEAIFIRQLKRYNAYIATGAIGFSCLLSVVGFLDYAVESGGFAHPSDAHAAETEHGAAHPRPSTTSRWSGRAASTGCSWAVEQSRQAQWPGKLRPGPTYRFHSAWRSTIWA